MKNRHKVFLLPNAFQCQYTNVKLMGFKTYLDRVQGIVYPIFVAHFSELKYIKFIFPHIYIYIWVVPNLKSITNKKFKHHNRSGDCVRMYCLKLTAYRLPYISSLRKIVNATQFLSRVAKQNKTDI